MSAYPEEPPSTYHRIEKGLVYEDSNVVPIHHSGAEYGVHHGEQRNLSRSLEGRHMQMIAIGGAIGAGLFVGSGAALQAGGPASVVICFAIIGVMLYFTMQALAELGVMFPVNGAFYQYAVRFIDPSWGFAIGADYAIQWLTILPFEITAASLTISFWNSAHHINVGVWVTIFLVSLCIVQIFGVRGYGEVEFVLSIIKIMACTGFIILGIIIDCGGVPGQPYIGGKYWRDPGAFANGFKGFCNVFTTASFAYGGTELVGLAAAEAANPFKSIPQATKQVLVRIVFFYVVCLLMVGLLVPYNNPDLVNATGANSKYSPFVIAINTAGIKVLPSIFNVVICLSVISVANSSTFGSTRTMQAMAAQGMAPKFLAYVDKRGRPIWCVLIQLAFGLLAYIQEANSHASEQFFDWLLALAGLANFFVWGSICFAHIRFRAGWRHHGHGVDELPYRASCGVIGSWIGLAMNIICMIAAFYAALWPLGGDGKVGTAKKFFQSYLAAPLILVLYAFWKVWSGDWSLYIRARDMDVTSGMRQGVDDMLEYAQQINKVKTWKGAPLRFIRHFV